MFVSGIGTATPPQRYSKAQCWEAFAASDWYARLSPRATGIMQTVLQQQDNGIETRHLAIDTLDEVFEVDPDILHRRFVQHAPALAQEAGERALVDAGLGAEEIDAIVVSSCTGYLCPGLSGYVVERLGLRSNVRAYDLVGQGCAAALPNWQLAEALLRSGQSRHVLSVCVEVCSAAMYLDNDPGVLISACLFGDGAGAAVLSAEPDRGKRRIEWKASGSLMNTEERNALRFETQQGLLRNILTRRVPRLAAEHAGQVLADLLSEAGLQQSDIRGWIMHAGGRDVLLALQSQLNVDAADFAYSASMLYNYGNLSSAFVYFVLQAALEDEAPGGWWYMSSFGAGFSCHGALLEVD
ncbi:MAG TPA: 3-oxoacyl-[acyl-carrier-protein] synthase III C-terminal domain-containing protein [Methylophilaceae bacterium]|nr:3-oxoacyl-[acyl-carrier-protein] synthase III C-terminal domain-containing protein [Methylophilaceae bacterium]